MSVATKSQIMQATAALMLTVDPSPSTALQAAYVTPDDVYPSYDVDLSSSNLPVCIVGEAVAEPEEITHQLAGRAVYRWQMELLFFLSDGLADTEIKQAKMEAVRSPWPVAVANVLFQNKSLGFTGLKLDYNFRIAAGHLGWAEKPYYGFRMLVPVEQAYVQAMSR